ncbi:7-cyano-7-deazaguanine synthase [Desulfonatronum lacustre]|uniref:7-cyano-7-deazaguanine synthase n=1 Tax=Desulfonatronum lacustre TaxID=66849 RepID=UPI00146F9A05|nr:7-cyano-7-deazaguanine synthase [Desulfonatronum lacustre]
MKNIIILWTGGFDSTYQLLQLLTVDKVNVSPIYIIDEERRSTCAEMISMKRIISKLTKKFPYVIDLLSPIQYFSMAGIVSNNIISDAFKRIRMKSFIGGQYEWLARFCDQNNMTDMQLCIHKDDKAHDVLVDVVIADPLKSCRVSKSFSDTDEYTLFKYYTFPVFSLTKIEMMALAKEQHVEEIMNMTWFCHSPHKNMIPCGTCNPCIYTMEEGLAHRLPYASRIKSYITKYVARPTKSAARRIIARLA